MQLPSLAIWQDPSPSGIPTRERRSPIRQAAPRRLEAETKGQLRRFAKSGPMDGLDQVSLPRRGQRWFLNRRRGSVLSLDHCPQSRNFAHNGLLEFCADMFEECPSFGLGLATRIST